MTRTLDSAVCTAHARIRKDKCLRIIPTVFPLIHDPHNE